MSLAKEDIFSPQLAITSSFPIFLPMPYTFPHLEKSGGRLFQSPGESSSSLALSISMGDFSIQLHPDHISHLAAQGPVDLYT